MTPASQNRDDGGTIAPRQFEIDGSTMTGNTLIGNGIETIAPVFTVEIAGDHETPFVEVELEHKEGDPSAIFALARKSTRSPRSSLA